MKFNFVYALALFIACLAALIAGWVVADHQAANNALNRLKTAETEQAATQVDTFATYNEYEASIPGAIEDRKREQ